MTIFPVLMLPDPSNETMQAVEQYAAKWSALYRALEADIKRLRRERTNEQYMREIATQMLGPKGAEVMRRFTEGGVVRFHASWGPEAHTLTGEERADVLIGFLDAPKGELVNDLDKHMDDIDARSWLTQKDEGQ